MGDYVWLSTAMKDGRQLRPLTHSFSDSEERMNYARECRKRNDAGERLGRECFPEMIFPSKYSKAPPKSLPDIFFAGSFWAVSERCADVLHQYDLGGGALYPVKVMQKDKVTPIGDHAWFCINFGNVKSAFLRERSDLSKFYGEIGGKPSPTTSVESDQCVVSIAAAAGPVVWIDTKLDEGLFVSRSLGDALRKAKCTSGWGLRRCRVVEG